MKANDYQRRSNEVHNALMSGAITATEAYEARQELVDVLRRDAQHRGGDHDRQQDET